MILTYKMIEIIALMLFSHIILLDLIDTGMNMIGLILYYSIVLAWFGIRVFITYFFNMILLFFGWHYPLIQDGNASTFKCIREPRCVMVVNSHNYFDKILFVLYYLMLKPFNNIKFLVSSDSYWPKFLGAVHANGTKNIITSLALEKSFVLVMMRNKNTKLHEKLANKLNTSIRFCDISYSVLRPVVCSSSAIIYIHKHFWRICDTTKSHGDVSFFPLAMAFFAVTNPSLEMILVVIIAHFIGGKSLI